MEEDKYEMQDRIDALIGMLDDTEEELGEANQQLFEIRHICKTELSIIEREGGICGGYLRILAVLDALNEQAGE